MSGNSCCSALQTAPMVSDFWRWTGSGWSSAPSATAGSVTSGSLTVGEPVRVDPLAVDVGAVERARVVEEPVAAAAHERGVLARDGDVVEEDAGLGRAPDRHLLARERERLADAAAAGADDERAALGRDVADVDGLELARLVVDHVGRGRRVLLRRLSGALERAALGAVVRAFGDDEPTFRTMACHPTPPASGGG